MAPSFKFIENTFEWRIIDPVKPLPSQDDTHLADVPGEQCLKLGVAIALISIKLNVCLHNYLMVMRFLIEKLID
jgi:hypothetical protein